MWGMLGQRFHLLKDDCTVSRKYAVPHVTIIPCRCWVPICRLPVLLKFCSVNIEQVIMMGNTIKYIDQNQFSSELNILSTLRYHTIHQINS